MISDPLLNLYFTSPAEAVFSLFRESIVAPFELSIGQALSTSPQRTNELDDLYLNTFYLNEDLLINPLPNSNLERQLKTDPNLAEVRDAIQDDCNGSQRDGFVIPYLPVLYYGGVQARSRLVGRITTYVLCRQNLLLHTQSFRILKDFLLTDLQQLITARTAENPQQRLTGGSVVELLTRYLRENRGRVLEEVYVQPEVNGLVTSPVVIPEVPPTLPLPIVEPAAEIPIVPPSAMLSPKDPSVFMPRQLSPGNTTAYDAFATVPSDVLRVMGLNMTLDAMANTCRTSQRFNQTICNNNEFWGLRTDQDFGRRNAATNTVMQRKPDAWSWKRYYAELSGNLLPNQILDFAELSRDPELLAELDKLSREDYEARVNEMRREAGLGVVDFQRPEYQASRKAPRQPQNVRRQLFPQPMVGPGVMGPVVENPNGGLMGEEQEREPFNLFDNMLRRAGAEVNVAFREGRPINGPLNVNRANMERVGAFPVRGQQMNQGEQLDILIPAPANLADIQRLFASVVDYHDFAQRYNPNPGIRQRAIPIRDGDEIPLHLNAAFEQYRNLIAATRGGQLIAGNVRNVIFGQLFERAALIGADPANVLHQQILSIEQLMPEGILWPQQSRQILMQQFEVYVAERRMNEQIQPAPAVGVPAAGNLAPPADLLDIHRLYVNLIANFDQPQVVQQPGIDAFLRSLDLRRGQQSRRPQFTRDMLNFRVYPELARQITPAQQARIADWLHRLENADRALPINLQQARGRVFRAAEQEADRFDVPGGLLQRQEPGIQIIRPEIRQRFFLYSALSEAIQADDHQTAGEQTQLIRLDVDRRAVLDEMAPIDQVRADLAEFQRYPLLVAGWSAKTREDLLNHLREIYEMPVRRADRQRVRQLNLRGEEYRRLYAVIRRDDQGMRATIRNKVLRSLVMRAANNGLDPRDLLTIELRNIEDGIGQVGMPWPRDGLPVLLAELQIYQNQQAERPNPVPFQAPNDPRPAPQQAIPLEIAILNGQYRGFIRHFNTPEGEQALARLVENIDNRRNQRSPLQQFVADMQLIRQYPVLAADWTDADREIIHNRILQLQRQEVPPVMIPANRQEPVRRHPVLHAEQSQALVNHYLQLLRAVQANDGEREQNETQWLTREVEGRARVNQMAPLEQIYADLEDISPAAVRSGRWPAGAPRLLQNHFKDFYQRPQQEEPPAEARRFYAIFAQLQDLRRGDDDPAYQRLLHAFFETVIAEAGRQNIPVQVLLERMIQIVTAYPNYAEELRNYFDVLRQEFTDYRIQKERKG